MPTQTSEAIRSVPPGGSAKSERPRSTINAGRRGEPTRGWRTGEGLGATEGDYDSVGVSPSALAALIERSTNTNVNAAIGTNNLEHGATPLQRSPTTMYHARPYKAKKICFHWQNNRGKRHISRLVILMAYVAFSRPPDYGIENAAWTRPGFQRCSCGAFPALILLHWAAQPRQPQVPDA